MGLIESGRRAPGARLEGEPHGRGRGRPRRPAPSAGDRAVGGVHGRARGRGAPRRRRGAGAARASRARSARSTARSPLALEGVEALDQRFVDQAMCDLDGTPDKSRLGANALLAVSLAVAKAAAEECGLPLYRYLGGRQRAPPARPAAERHQRRRARAQLHRLPGVHDRARSARRRSPRRCATARRPTTRCARVLADKGLSTGVGDEGGFAPDLPDNEAAITVLLEAIERAGYAPGDEVAIALDPATSELWRDGAYELKGEGRTLSSERARRLLGRAVRPVPDRLHRGRHGRGRLGGLARAHRAARAAASSSSVTTCS